MTFIDNSPYYKNTTAELLKHLSIKAFIFFCLLIISNVSAKAIPFINGALPDTLNPDTVQVDVQPTSNLLEYPVYRYAEDSIKADWSSQKVYLYGKAKVIYDKIELRADVIVYDMRNGIVTATYLLDSLGKPIGTPVFTEGSEEIQADTIKYNFNTKRGVIKKVRTQVAEGYIDGELVVKDENDILYIKDGRYCPCEDPDAHTKFRVTKIKVMDDLIVTGPGYLEMGGVPTPIMFPFGFFPNKKERNAGILIPTVGEDATLGFFLKEGGFYWPINDYIDTEITGSIFTGGSYGLNSFTRYKRLYKRSGDVNISYNKNKFSDPEYPDYAEESNFWLTWNHVQDPKANPNNNFNARINAGTSNNFTNNVNSTSQQYLSNQFQSNINYTRIFPGKPFTLSAGASHNQNTSTGVVNITLPNASFNVNRFYIAKMFNKNGTKRSKLWKSFEKIGTTARLEGINTASLQDTLMALNNMSYLSDNMRNGFKHTVNINTSTRLLGSRLTLTPSMNWVGRYYFKTLTKSVVDSVLVSDTLDGFSYNDNRSWNAALTTKLYGYYAMRGPKQRVFRHVLTPNVTFSYRKDFDTRKFLTYVDTVGDTLDHYYSPYDIGVYGVSSSGESGMLSFNLINTLDMKVKSVLDSTGESKKVKIIENINLRGGYDFIADSLNISNLTVSGRTTLFKVVNINASTTLDPYWYDASGVKRNILQIDKTGNLFRLSDASLAGGFRLASKNKEKAQELTQDEEDDIVGQGQDPFDYLKVPWAFNLNYTLGFNRQFITREDATLDSTITVDTVFFTQTARLNGDFSLTPKWRITVNTGYDFTNKALAYTTIGIERDLNCWTARFNWIPFGDRRSYALTIALKNPLLKDVKYTRQRTWYNQDFF